jgi:hypothetical protein
MGSFLEGAHPTLDRSDLPEAIIKPVPFLKLWRSEESSLANL